MDSDNGYVWHYTVETLVVAIAYSRRLMPAFTHATAPRSGDEILWFSRNQQWDPFALADNGLSEAKQLLSRAALQARFDLYRFGLPEGDIRLLPWPTVTRVADIHVREAMEMVARGLRCGAAPTDWVGALTAIPLRELHLERWTGAAWMPADLNELLAKVP